MPQFDEHISQAKRNIGFFQNIHNSVDDCLDWQVTSLFYVAVHLVNAHLSNFGQQYRNHNETIHAINFANATSIMSIDQNAYTSYQSLQNVSRKARYLINAKDGKLLDTSAHFIYDKHLSKALRNLDVIMCYFYKRYAINFPDIFVKCAEFKFTPEVKYIKALKA